MADVYADDGGSGTSPYETWAKAGALITDIDAYASAGDTIYVGSTTLDTEAATRAVLFSAATAASPIRVIAADPTSGEPPSTYQNQVAGSGYIQCTVSTSDLTFGNQYVICYGLNLIAPDRMTLYGRYFDCAFTSSQPDFITIGAAEYIENFTGCTFDCSYLSVANDVGVLFKNCAFTTSQTYIFIMSAACRYLIVEDSDLSDSQYVFSTLSVNEGTYIIRRCRLATSWALASSLAIAKPGATFLVESCIDGTQTDPIIGMMQLVEYYGQVDRETTTYRTSGANDGTRGFSWKMTSTANSLEYCAPLKSPPVQFYVTGGSPITITVHITHESQGSGAGSDFQDDEFWIEIGGPDDGSYAQGHFLTSLPTDILTTPADLTNNTEGWNSAKAVKQQVTLTYTPQDDGQISVRFCLGKASSVAYVCPKFVVS